jgi:lysophospholipase L1-like esterase
MERIQRLLQRTEPVKWLFTGDSITHGAAHTLGWRDYTELFSERVRFELQRPRDFVLKTGISGWTIQRIANDLDWNVLQFHPDCVSIMVGMNDCKDGPEGLTRFQETYLRTIARIRSECDAEILLHTPNWILATDGEVRLRNLPAYVEAIRQIAREVDAPLIDHFAIWAQAEPSGAMHHWIAHGCHPNEYGHRAFARAIFRALGIWDDRSWTCQLNVPGMDPLT